MNPRNVGEVLLTRLKQLGVEYFFANPGTEFISVIRGFQELPKDSVPVPITVPHEFQAVSMAYGYYLATGRPQAVMTHATVGAANALIGLIGASRMNIPLIFISGMTSQSERKTLGHRDKLIHWSQDTKDQGSIFREYVKWEAVVSDPESIQDILDRAYAIATSAPCGPVAIKISRDILLSELVSFANAQSAVTRQALPAPSPEAMVQVLEWMKSAERPLVITNRLGIDPFAASLLSDVSTRHGLGVVTPDDFYMSFPADHSNHLGFHGGEVIGDADFIVVLDTETPWFPLERGPSSQAKVVHVGTDPLFQAIPLRSHRGNLILQSCPRLFLTRLNEAFASQGLVDLRIKWIQSKKQSRSKSAHGMGSLNARAVSEVLSEFLGADTILINELSLSPEELGIRYPGSYFRSGSASPLGWGVGCALGLSLANREKTVIAGVGDGVFYLSPMLPALLVSVELRAPFITLVLNNGGMASISKTVRDFFPGSPDKLPLTSFGDGKAEIEKCASVVAGLGLRAETKDELRKSLRSAIDFCRKEKKPAVINAIFSD